MLYRNYAVLYLLLASRAKPPLTITVAAPKTLCLKK